MLHQELVQQMEEVVIQVVEVHHQIQVRLERQVMELLILVVVAVVVQHLELLAVVVDQVSLQLNN